MARAVDSGPVTPTVCFADVDAPVPDLELLSIRVAELTGALSPDAGLDACLDAVRDWDVLRRDVSTYEALVELRYHQATDDPDARAARQAWDEARPRWTELLVTVKRALLTHPRRAELEQALGAQAFALWGSEVLAFDPAIKDGMVAESGLTAEYVGLLASARVGLNGEELNLPELVKYRQHADRPQRHQAERAHWQWYEANAGALDRIFDDLVRGRTEMARHLGLDDFVELGYRRMCRVDYNRADVDRLRTAVRDHVVPFAAELRRRQASTLGPGAVAAWDEQVHYPAGSPVPGGGPEWLLARAQEMFDEMGPLGPFFAMMNEGGYLDLPARPGKSGGGFCTSFPTVGMPFVFANFNGTRPTSTCSPTRWGMRSSASRAVSSRSATTAGRRSSPPRSTP